jgi:hypothetical protein
MKWKECSRVKNDGIKPSLSRCCFPWRAPALKAAEPGKPNNVFLSAPAIINN